MFARLRSHFRVTRPRSRASPQVEDSFARFRRCLGLVERAKESLAAAAPRGRAQGVPIAEALIGFEVALRGACEAMEAWRTPEVEDVWQQCEVGLDEALHRAAAFRLGEGPSGYEQLYTVLADLMEPLESFTMALSRFHSLGC